MLLKKLMMLTMCLMIFHRHINMVLIVFNFLMRKNCLPMMLQTFLVTCLILIDISDKITYMSNFYWTIYFVRRWLHIRGYASWHWSNKQLLWLWLTIAATWSILIFVSLLYEHFKIKGHMKRMIFACRIHEGVKIIVSAPMIYAVVEPGFL